MVYCMPIRLRPTHTSCRTYATYPVVSHNVPCHIEGIGKQETAMKHHFRNTRIEYVIVRNVAQYPAVVDTYSVVVLGSHENLSHHESESEARAAVKRYKEADQRRARQRARAEG